MGKVNNNPLNPCLSCETHHSVNLNDGREASQPHNPGASQSGNDSQNLSDFNAALRTQHAAHPLRNAIQHVADLRCIHFVPVF
jgi:hypothetical protein